MRNVLMILLLSSLFINKGFTASSLNLQKTSNQLQQFTSEIDIINKIDTSQIKKKIQPFSIVAFISALLLPESFLLFSTSKPDPDKYEDNHSQYIIYTSIFLSTISVFITSCILELSLYKKKKHSKFSLLLTTFSIILILGLALGLALLLLIS